MCNCLSEWGVEPDPCNDNSEAAAANPVRLLVTGWLGGEWPYLPGRRRCRHSVCDVLNDLAPAPPGAAKPPHVHLYSIISAATDKMPADGSIMVGVALESRATKPVHAAPEFRYFFHLGVSYARGHLDLAISYNNYFGGQLRSKGAPFSAKRNSLPFMHSNCGAARRNELFEQIGKRMKIDSFGPCRHNADLAAELPQCAGMPQAGNRTWLEKECVLHHYKFFLAIENSRDTDYVTEKLWQGMRAGAVPIYWGAPNIRDFLPHPDAAVLVDDFASVDELVSYVKYASADEALYNRHLKWKDGPLPGPFIDLVVERPVDSVFCQVCDEVAARYGKAENGIGPVVGYYGDTVVLPPCVSKSIRDLQSPIQREWFVPASRKLRQPRRKSRRVLLPDEPEAAAAATAPSASVDRASLAPPPPLHVYVMSVQNATERHDHMRRVLGRHGLSADLVSGFDASQVTNEMYMCWHPRSPMDPRTLYGNRLGRGVLSLAMKHMLAAWDMFDRGVNASVFLEDDANLSGDFTVNVTRALASVPAGWDLIVLGTCFDLHPPPGSQSVSFRLFKAPLYPGISRCTHALLYSYQGARKLLASLPMRWPIDFQLNMIGAGMNAYWMEPPVALQSGNFSSMLTDRG